MHPFDETIHLTAGAEGRFTGHTHDAYWNVFGPFGGTTAATLLNAVMQDPRRQGEPVALTVNFAAPLARGAFRIELQCHRSGRSTQHWSMLMLQDGAEGSSVVMTGVAVFGVRREAWSAPETRMPQVPGPDALRRFPPRPGLNWPDRYDIRYVDMAAGLGEGPASDSSLNHVWLADDPPRPLDFQSLASICDVFFPRLFVRRPKFVPIGTVSLNIHFHADAAMLAAQASAPVLGVARGNVFERGFFDQQGEIWGSQGVAEGRLLATTQQVVWYKE